MMNSLDVLILLVGISGLACLYALLPQRWKKGVLAAALLTAMLTSLSAPATAAAADDNALSQDQKALNETLKTTPHGNQYQGIEYPQVTGEPLSDREITRRIQNEIPNDLKLSVSNGSVRLSGPVSDRRTAQRIVQDIKEVPGVHEISYDLGLNG